MLSEDTAARLARQSARVRANHAAWTQLQATGQYAPPPAKPARMSEKLYRELYDSRPVLLAVGPDRLVIKAAGPVSGEVIAATYRRDNRPVAISYA